MPMFEELEWEKKFILIDNKKNILFSTDICYYFSEKILFMIKK